MNEEIISKIKRLLALAEHNSNPNEAAAALSRAQKLIKIHNIDEEDLDLSEIGEIEKQIFKGLKDKHLIERIACICSKTFGLEAYCRSIGKARFSVNFVGPKDKLPLVSYIFDFLSRQTLNAKAQYKARMKKVLDQQAQDWIECLMPEEELRTMCISMEIDPRRYAYKALNLNTKLKVMVKSYLIGYLQSINEHVQEFKDGNAERLTRLYLDKHHQNMRNLKTKKIDIDALSFEKGINDGNEVNLLRPISGEASVSLSLND